MSKKEKSHIVGVPKNVNISIIAAVEEDGLTYYTPLIHVLMTAFGEKRVSDRSVSMVTDIFTPCIQSAISDSINNAIGLFGYDAVDTEIAITTPCNELILIVDGSEYVAIYDEDELTY